MKVATALGHHRVVAAALAALTIALGLASRSFAAELPVFLATYAGDTLWALLIYLLATTTAPRVPIAHRALASLVFALAIECSQLYRAQWIDSLRATTIGALTLGSGFLWSDVLCYATGIAAGAAIKALATRTQPARVS